MIDAVQNSQIGLASSEAEEAKRPLFYAKLIAENSTDQLMVLNERAQVEWINTEFTRQTGYTLEQCGGLSPDEFMAGPKTDRSKIRELMTSRQTKSPVTRELLQYRKSKDPYWADITLCPIVNENGQITHFLATIRDVTDRKTLELERQASQKAEERRKNERHVLSKTTEWLYAARSLTDLFNVVKRCAPKLMPKTSGALYIYSNSRDVLEKATDWGEHSSCAFIEADECWALRRGRAYHYGVDDIEFPCEHFHEQVDSSFCLPLLAHGETIGMLWCHSDEKPENADVETSSLWETALMLAEQVSLTIANVRLRQELEDRSIKDPLTGLWNRRYYLESLRREVSRAKETNRGFALISIDIDHFKRFNDHHGHDAGDLVLRRVTTELVSSMGPSGIVCRVGGEELAIICPEVTESVATDIANKLRKAVKQIEIVYQGQVLPAVTMSAGIATYTSGEISIDELIRNADNALYQAKHAGRDQVITFNNEELGSWVMNSASGAAPH